MFCPTTGLKYPGHSQTVSLKEHLIVMVYPKCFATVMEANYHVELPTMSQSSSMPLAVDGELFHCTGNNTHCHCATKRLQRLTYP